MITDTKATIASILDAGGSLPRWIDRMPAAQQRKMLRAECRRVGIVPTPVSVKG